MFLIVNLTVSKPDQTVFFFGGLPGQETIGRPGILGPQGASYILALPGAGYIQLTDLGPAPPGSAGDWAVKISSGSSLWTYGGQGEASITIAADGSYTVTGGSNSVTGKLVAWQ